MKTASPKAILIVVDEPANWPLELEDAELVSSRAYLSDNRFSALRGALVFNLCRSYRYQSLGYYVSLLATARGHRPLPEVAALLNLRTPSSVRLASEELDDIIQKSLDPVKSPEFTLSIYLGHNLAKRYDRLSQHLFRMFPAPFMRAIFVRNPSDEKWHMQNISAISGNEIPEHHRSFAVDMAREYFRGARPRVSSKAAGRFDLAVLVNPADPEPPSNPTALKRFVKAAETVGFNTEIITREDFGRLPQFDALFIRETTAVNHYTYRFARRAAAEGLVVIDDPDSILKCTNKVFLAELLDRHQIATPRTLIVHRGNHAGIEKELGFPCILKQPDSSFSQGVLKVENPRECAEAVSRLLQKSEMIIAQEFMPTSFDWRIGVFDRKPVFACKYYMARSHWQILKRDASGEKKDEGCVETFPFDQIPPAVMRTALKASNLIGDGLYGVDLKQVGKKVYVIEVNDNPNIDSGLEDHIDKGALYEGIMATLMKRVEIKKGVRKR